MKKQKIYGERQTEIDALPKVGTTMAACCPNQEDGSYSVGDYYYVEAIDVSRMTLRLIHTENQTIKKGKFIMWPNGDFLAVIFHEDISIGSLSTQYMQAEFVQTIK